MTVEDARNELFPEGIPLGTKSLLTILINEGLEKHMLGKHYSQDDRQELIELILRGTTVCFPEANICSSDLTKMTMNMLHMLAGGLFVELNRRTKIILNELSS